MLLTFSPSDPALADPPETVTIEAQREQLRHEVNQFVQASIVSPHTGDSLLRWDSAVCPLVAGLPRQQGEFVLARLSALARAAGAPLDGEHCRANLYLIVARNPGGFLSLWWDHDPRLFNTTHGIGGVKRFIETDRPVRVWYNYMAVDADLSTEIQTLLAQSVGIGPGGTRVSYPVSNNPAALGSRLTYHDVRADAGDAPSILKLFSEQDSSPPQGLTAWDRALLHAVYSTKQKDRLQLSEIETATLNQLVAAPAH